MNLYGVRLAVDVVVWAADEAAAGKIALEHERDERSHAKAEAAIRIIDPANLPGNWDAGCLPWGRDDDTTIGEIIGFPAKEIDAPSPACPICHRTDAERMHHEGDLAVPECHYWLCECGHEWGHE